MASQKLTDCCVAAIALAASTYVSTPHCSTSARLAFGAFYLASDNDAFLRKHQNLWHIEKGRVFRIRPFSGMGEAVRYVGNGAKTRIFSTVISIVCELEQYFTLTPKKGFD